jgi:hypothetical protein
VKTLEAILDNLFLENRKNSKRETVEVLSTIGSQPIEIITSKGRTLLVTAGDTVELNFGEHIIF